MAYGERQQPLFWAQSSSNNDRDSGLLGFTEAYQIFHVGPEAVSCFGASPNLGQDDHPLKLMTLNQTQRRDVCGATTYGNHGCSSLHCKKPLSRKGIIHFPELPSAQQINHGTSRSSLLCKNQRLQRLELSLTLEDMRGRIVALATDQLGSAVLSMKMEEGLSQEEIQIIVLEVLEYFGDLMRNQFGCNFVQKLFVTCSEDQRTRIIMSLTRSSFKLIGICLNPQGARSVQKLLEKLLPPQIPLMVSALSSGVVPLASDQNGQHVLQYCLKRFPRKYNKYIFREIAGNCFKIATNKSGCCVLLSCVENSDGEAREKLISAIDPYALDLAEDPYGNYVVQHLLALRLPEVAENLLRRCKGHFASLSCNKYASNVVEKFLIESGANNSAKIIMELLASPTASVLLVNPYGNFVIQSALLVSKGDIRNALLCFV